MRAKKNAQEFAVKALEVQPKDVWGLRMPTGEVGIEVEVEGFNLPRHVEKFWKVVEDGSLRGEAREYVLASPVSRKNVREALDLLAKTLEENRARVDNSYRTSVHIHVNQRDMNFRTIFTEICLYVLFEDLLINLCGEDRIGNLFCLRVRDAEHIIDTIRDGIQTGNYRYFRDKNAFKYGAVNISALGDYGSLEYRAFRGSVDPNEIEQWVNILLDIKDGAKVFKNPQDLVVAYSQHGVGHIIGQVFRPENQRLILDMKDVEAKTLDGIRRVQEIAYAIPSWNLPEPVPGEPLIQKDNYGGDLNNFENGLINDLEQLRPRFVPRAGGGFDLNVGPAVRNDDEDDF